MKNKQEIFDPVERVNDAMFDAEIDKLIAYSEDLRIDLMRQHRRRAGLATTAFIFLVFVGSLGFGYYIFFEGRVDIGVMCILLTIGVSYMLHLWSEKPLLAYKAQYKLKFMPKLAKLLGGLRFFPTRGIGRQILSKTGVLPKFETYRAEDCFMGVYKGVKVIFSEARLYEGKREVSPVFDGIFVLLEASKDVFDAHTILTSDHRMAQTYGPKRWNNLKPVEIKNSSPESVPFKAFSSAPEFAQSFIDDKLLKELGEASLIFNDAPVTAVMFRKKYVFIMIPYAHDMFEASDIHIPVKTRQHAMQCRNEINQILEVIDVFDIFKDDIAKQAAPHIHEEFEENSSET